MAVRRRFTITAGTRITVPIVGLWRRLPGPARRVPPAMLRARIAHIPSHLTRALFMSRTVHSPTAGKPA